MFGTCVVAKVSDLFGALFYSVKVAVKMSHTGLYPVIKSISYKKCIIWITDSA